MVTFKQVKQFLQSRYDLDAATAAECASSFMKTDIPIWKIRTLEQLDNYCFDLEKEAVID